jgi:hypothetical protein
MPHITTDRVRDTATTTGTGSFTVSGTAPTGYRTFSAVCATSDTFWYSIAHQSADEWEVGLGTYSGTNTVARTTVLKSSNSNAAVNFSAGTKDVFITLAADKTVQQDNNNSVVLTSGTLTTSQPLLDLTQTWNAGAVPFTGFRLNVTDTASASASMLMNLQVGGATRAKISKAGAFLGVADYPNAMFGDSAYPTTGITPRGVSNRIDFYVNGNETLRITNIDVRTVSGVAFLVESEAFLRADGANILAQRNGTNAQAFRLYNTFTDASNYERLAITWSSNVAYVRPQNAGSGSARIFVPVTGATTVSGLPTASTAGAGARAFVTDANATTFLSVVAGGGSNNVPVVSDGTNWLIG